MPFIGASGTAYKLCLMDTNALSEIVKRPTVEGRGFVERFPPSGYAPCFTVFNLLELRQRPDVFEKFAQFFSVYPCLLLHHTDRLLDLECECTAPVPIARAIACTFGGLGHDPRAFCDELFARPAVAESERTRRGEAHEVLQVWLRQKQNFVPTGPAANAEDARRYVKAAFIDTIAHLQPDWLRAQIESGRAPTPDQLPSLQVQLFSQYYRLFDAHWDPRPQEVTDVQFSGAVPYADAVVTERFQAGVLEKIRSEIPSLARLEIARLRDLRCS